MRYVFITGANRGLGYGFVQHYLSKGDHVFATCRIPDVTDALHQLAREHADKLDILQLDVTDPEEIAAARAAVGAKTERIDLLINNAGVNPERPHLNSLTLETMSVDDAVSTFKINALAPVLVTRAFIDLLKKSDEPRVINLSSGAGSIAERTRERGGTFSYAASKAALNMYTRAIAGTNEMQGIAVVAFSPGWVKTEMGGEEAEITVEESIASLTEQIDKLTPADTGKFLSRDGTARPW
jgi:NAD(P)-dependent dehydrogenase (short-subunit alcohol dehydrogenase family)